MEQPSTNENVISGNNETIEIYMNDVVLEDGYKENPSVQTKTNRNPKNGNEKVMKENLKKLHAQRKIWKPHGKTSLCWIFHYINDNAQIDLVNTQIMRCTKSSNWNKSNNSNEERIDFLLQNQWNNFFLKTYGYRSFFYCKNVYKRNE